MGRDGGLRLARVWMVAVLVAAAMSGARRVLAEENGVGDAGPVSFPPPYQVLLRSLALPGWGQLENGQPQKAGFFMALEGTLAASAFIELRRADQAFEAHMRAAERGDAAEADAQFVRYEERRARATGRFWWTTFTVLVSMLDAYVDAHFRDFVETDLVELTAGAAPGTGSPEATLALRFEF